MACHIDGFLAQGVGHSGLDLFLHSQVDDLDHILEGCLAAQSAGAYVKGLRVLLCQRIGDLVFGHDAQIDQINGAVLIAALCGAFHQIQLQVDAVDLLGHGQCIFHARAIPHHQRLAGLVDLRIVQRLHGDLRSIAKGVAHRNTNDRTLHPCSLLFSDQAMPFALFSSSTLRRASVPSSLR